MCNAILNELVYFLVAGPFVKIGYTCGIKTRLNDLQVGCPYKQELVATLPGSPIFERQVHELAEDYHYRAEWYHYRDDLKAWINGADVVKQVSYDDGDIEYCFEADLQGYDAWDGYDRSRNRAPPARTLSAGPVPIRRGPQHA